mgnify:CR=1 FL=1
MGSMLAYLLTNPMIRSVSRLGNNPSKTDNAVSITMGTVIHGFIKAVLFLVAGAIICTTGRTRVEELRGIGKEMPLTMWCYTM